ncbi:acyltransferase family protein [Kitasatospora sp. NBC_01302]|uniref:acyltransferase family protein n=1 Tax=Kitasatospora sp. NBC_01302 TaxID=2903575 RepID=UPI002E159F16|nr:acyltransferase [Kitasatospora sp. NBC_01302]
MPIPVLPSRLKSVSADRPARAEQSRGSGKHSRPRLYVLDGMRLLAALSVMSFHLIGKPVGWEQTWHGRPDQLMPGLHGVAIYGWIGVELFFLISGFVICMSCWGKRPQDFFVSRVVRLYPAYWAAIAITTAVVLWAGYPFSTVKDLTARNVMVNATMLPSPLGAPLVDPSYWTLWVEMLFYVLFAVVVARGLTYRRVVAFCGIWTFLAAIAPSVNFPLLSAVVQPGYAPLFVAGITMYLMYRFGKNLLLWGMLGFSFLLAQYQLLGTVQMYQMYLPQHISWSVAAGLLTLCFLLVLAAAIGWFNWIKWRWLTVAGSLTYPLYLLHQEIGTTMICWLRQSMQPYAVLAVVVPSLLLLAYMVHRLVERPLTRGMKKGLDSAFASLTAIDATAGAPRTPDTTARELKERTPV